MNNGFISLLWIHICHEWRLVLREPRFWVPFLIPPAFMAGMQIWLLAGYGISAAAAVAQPTSMLVTGVLLSSVAISLAADSFAGERERETLDILLVSPLGVDALFAAKGLALISLPLPLALLVQYLFWSLGQHPSVLLWQAWALTASSSLFLLSSAMLVSLFAETVRAAAQISVLFLLVVLALVQGFAEAYLLHPFWALIAFVSTLVFSVLGWALGLRRFRRF